MRTTKLAVFAVLALGSVGCADDRGPAAAAPDRALVAVQRERLARVQERQSQRGSALSAVVGQRRRATAELVRVRRLRGRDTARRFHLRYGSDGTGDPPGWRQAGAEATQAPNSTAQAIASFRAAQATGRIALAGAAKDDEIARGLIDDRVLQVLVLLSRAHRLRVDSLRLSHPRTVQDELGTPTDSNHVFGRAADIGAVDGIPCTSETAGAPYHTLVDNPPPAQPGPCLAVAYDAASLVDEVIFDWRVPGPTGSSLPNHDDHVHVGFRSYPDTDRENEDPAEALEMPGRRGSRTLAVPATAGTGTSDD